MNKKNGFSLIELLVVLAIIIILASLIVPAITNSLEKSRVAQCGNHLRSIGTAINLYAAENEGHLPGLTADGQSWDVALLPFVKNNRMIFKCPSDKRPGFDTDLYNDPNANNNQFPLSYAPNVGDAGLAPFQDGDVSSTLGRLNAAGKAVILIGERHNNNSSMMGNNNPVVLEQTPATIHKDSGNYYMSDGSVKFMPEVEAEKNTHWTLERL